jgi:hypothetical protein
MRLPSGPRHATARRVVLLNGRRSRAGWRPLRRDCRQGRGRHDRELARGRIPSPGPLAVRLPHRRPVRHVLVCHAAPGHRPRTGAPHRGQPRTAKDTGIEGKDRGHGDMLRTPHARQLNVGLLTLAKAPATARRRGLQTPGPPILEGLPAHRYCAGITRRRWSCTSRRHLPGPGRVP